MGEYRRKSVEIEKSISYIMGIPRREEDIIDVEQMTDWVVYTPEFAVNLDSIYLLEM